jgi:hypothetical protein
MARLTPAAAHYRARVAGLHRAVRNGERPVNDTALQEARRNLEQQRALDRVDGLVAELVAAAPPLTDEQRLAISSLLMAGGDIDA